jgi:hypothetical protein
VETETQFTESCICCFVFPPRTHATDTLWARRQVDSCRTGWAREGQRQALPRGKEGTATRPELRCHARGAGGKNFTFHFSLHFHFTSLSPDIEYQQKRL